MHPDFWHERWQSGRIGFHEDGVNAGLVRWWPTLELPAGSRVLVPLCGKAAGLAWLRDQGHDVVGIELSGVACEAFFDEQGLTPLVGPYGPFTAWRTDRLTLLQGDVFDLPPDVQFDAIWDRAATVALPVPMRGRYAERLAQAAKPGARMLLTVLDYPQQEYDGPPFAVSLDEVRRLYDEAFDVTVLEQGSLDELATAWNLSRMDTTVAGLVRRR